ncbi:MAG: hypothetical protein ACRD0W_00460 [Acidimicrobiales bacterium]
MPRVGRAEVRIIADARGFARDAEREINDEIRKIDVDTKTINRKIDNDTRAGFVSAARNGVQAFGIILQGGVSVQAAGAFGVSVLGALVPAAIAAGTLAAGGLVTAFGAGLVGIGFAAAAQNEKVKESFTELKESVSATLTEISVPFEATLLDIAEIAQRTFDAFTPALRESFATLAPEVSEFADQVGQAFEVLAPTIKPVTDAFKAILDELGPTLVNEIFPGLAEAITNVADAISENPDVFVSIVQFLFDIVEGAINVIAELTRLATWFAEHPAAIVAALAIIGAIILALTGGFLGFVAAMIAFGIAVSVAWDFIVAAGARARDLIIGALVSISSFFTQVWQGAQIAVQRAGSAISGFLTNLGRTFANIGRTIVNWFVTVRNGIQGFINNAISNFRSFPGRIAAALSGLASVLFSPFRNGINRIIRAWNGLSFTIGGGSIFGIDIPSVTISTPNIPTLQRGGIIERAGMVEVGEAGRETVFLPQGAAVSPLPLSAQESRGPQILEGELFLDSGEFLGVVRGQISESNRGIRRRALAGSRI